ncbi:hypothetical protein XELAEV_18011193mg [Xenopus laevis]|uniref:Ig-like domain-containing protein n=1 Tax=Xenopus laevis TaxID=8355 RepID=A0A974HX33_XENLA|nr:hypothetical protein XELAEV_18011193mg [Xenopus laevis]
MLHHLQPNNVTTGASWAQREVTIQQGPLYRTEGTHISIWCMVRGYQGPSGQTFDWSIYLPSAPNKEIQIVSSNKTSFSYAIYSQRVRSRDIYVERVSGDHALLHIRQLQEQDEGEYECHTPNTDPTFHGSYSAKMNLYVLPDTLVVMMPPQDLQKLEGTPLELYCHVSVSPTQHTHLSITWLLTSGRDMEIVSLTRDFVLLPGAGYMDRFLAGDVRMDKLNSTHYRLQIRALQKSEQGHISCQAQEWIQDPDGKWTIITQKQSNRTSVMVQPLGGNDFEVQAQATDSPILPGSPLEVTCTISTQDPTGRLFHVTWLLDSKKVVSLHPSGILSFGGNLGARNTLGQISVGRRTLVSWYLRISQVLREDGGSYTCQVSEERAAQGPTESKTSAPVSVIVAQKESQLGVILSTSVHKVYEGESVQFQCQVTGYSGLVSLSWYMTGSDGQRAELVALQRDGSLVVGETYLDRHNEGLLLAQRMEGGHFSLKLEQVRARDKGKYTCQATEWQIGSDSNWIKLGSQSAEKEVDITPLGSSLSLSLSVRSSQVITGSTIRLICKVSAEYSLLGKPKSWSWHHQNSSDPNRQFQQLVKSHYTGTTVWHEGMSGFQGKLQLEIRVDYSVLTVYNIERGQAGLYCCKVGIVNDQAGTTSNKLAIQLTVPESLLLLETSPEELLLTRGQDDMSITCHIDSRVPGAQVRVTWKFFPAGVTSAQEIVTVTQEGLLSYSSDISSALRSRILIERNSPDSFTLRIMRPSQEQWGSYGCAVSEWLLEGSGNWVKLGEKNTGLVPVQFRDSEETLHIPKMNITAEVTEAEDVTLYCPLGDVRSLASRYSLSWYFQASGSRISKLIYQASWEGVIEYEESLAKRLLLVAPNWGNYSLILQSVGLEDAGVYHCQVEEWRLEPEEGEWRLKAADGSGFHNLKVLSPGVGLTLNSTNLTLLVLQGGQNNITLPCQVLSLSSTNSALSVAWWKSSLLGQEEQLLFSVSYEGQFTYPTQEELEGARLQFERPSKLLFLLRILQPGLDSSGTYHCRVRESVSSPRGARYLQTELRAGNISVTFLPEESGPSQICTTASIFHLLLGAAGLLLLLVALLLVFGGRRWCRGVGSTRMDGRKGHRGLWAPTNMADPPVYGGADIEEKEPMGMDRYEETKA